MGLVKNLYAQESVEHNTKAWNRFTFLSPNFSYLRTDSTKRALADKIEVFL